MSETAQQLILNRLMTLKELEHVHVTASDEKGTVNVELDRYHALSFRFVWALDHYVGYVTDEDNTAATQAVVSLYTPLDAVRFGAAYATLADLRAKQKG